MPRAAVYYNNWLAGYLEKRISNFYSFKYDTKYLLDPVTPSISLTLPKSTTEYTSRELFPFFHGLLAEGINKEIQCKLLKIDPNDDFTRLLDTACYDTIGAITVKEIQPEI
jgi:HipA-like protein